MTERRAITPARRRRILEAAGYRCYVCCQVRRPDQLDIDHQCPLMLGGSDEDENLAPICRHPLPCHKVKSAKENHARGKINRLSGRNKPKVKRKWPSRKIPSRPFSNKGRGFGSSPRPRVRES